MIFDYAIEPEVLIEWSRNQIVSAYIRDNFGLGKTRLMAEYPNFKKWKKQLNKASKQADITDLDKTRLVEIFRILTETRVRRTNHGYDGEKEWLINAASEIKRGKPFKGIIARTNYIHKDYVLSNDRVGEWNDEFWCTDVSKRVSKKADQLAEALAPILQNCMGFTLIDPYFRASKQKWRESFRCILDKFMEYRSSSDKFSIELHVASHCQAPSAEYLRNEFRSQKFMDNLPSNIKLKIKRWVPKMGGEKLHDRFLLTDIGCVQSSYGFDDGTDNEATSLTLLSREDCLLIRGQYLGDTPAFDTDFEMMIH